MAFGSETRTAFGSHDMFVAKYKPDGSLEWLQRAGGGSATNFDSVQGFGIAVDGSGVYVTGSFSIGTFDNTTMSCNASFPMSPHPTSSDPAPQVVQAPNCDDSAFLAKYLSDGTLAWAKRINQPDADGFGVVVDSATKSVYVTGNLFNGKTQNAFIAKSDTDTGSDSIGWAFPSAGIAGAFSLAIALGGPDHAVYITGNFKGTVNFEYGSSSDAARNIWCIHRQVPE